MGGRVHSRSSSDALGSYWLTVVVVVVVEGQGGIFALDVSHILGPLNYGRCDTNFPAL